MAKMPDQTKTTIKGGRACVHIMAAGNYTIRRMLALLAEIKTNASPRADLTSIADDCEANVAALVEAVRGLPICAADAHRPREKQPA